VEEICGHVGLPRATYYRHRRGSSPPENGRGRGRPPIPLAEELRERIIVTAHRHPVLGYKKLHAVLKREGVEVSRKIVYRVLREERLLKARHPARAAREVHRLRLRELTPIRPNQLWQMDVVYVWIPDFGWWYQIDVIDYFSRYLLAQRFTWSYSAMEGVRALRQAVAEAERCHDALEAPVYLLTDNGTTFIAKRFRLELSEAFLTKHGADLVRHIRIGYRMPEHLGLLERFHGSLKAEAIWPNWFGDPLDARRTLLQYGEYYNYERPHWALGLRTPAEAYLGVTSWQEAQCFRQPVLIAAEKER